ncbi:MAG: hypothetical protein ACRDUW_08500, partial [Pseudonocardiaceae bacterium]
MVDLVGDVFGGGSGEAGGDDDGAVSAAKPDEPDSVVGSALGAGGAVVGLGVQWLVWVSSVLAV